MTYPHSLNRGPAALRSPAGRGSIRILRCKSKRVNGVQVPVLGTTRRGRAAVRRSSSNPRLQPTAGAKRRARGRRRSAGRG